MSEPCNLLDQLLGVVIDPLVSEVPYLQGTIPAGFDHMQAAT